MRKCFKGFSHIIVHFNTWIDYSVTQQKNYTVSDSIMTQVAIKCTKLLIWMPKIKKNAPLYLRSKCSYGIIKWQNGVFKLPSEVLKCPSNVSTTYMARVQLSPLQYYAAQYNAVQPSTALITEQYSHFGEKSNLGGKK